MKKCFQRVEGTNLWTIDPSRHEDILAPESRCIGRKRRSFSSTAGDAASAAAAAPARSGSPTSKRQAAPRPHATPTKKRATAKVAKAAKPLPSAAVTTNADTGTNHATASMEEGFYDQLVANGMLPGSDDAETAGSMDAHSPTSATEPHSPQAYSDSGSCSPLQSAGLPRHELGTELEYTSFLRNAVAIAGTSMTMGSSLLWPSSNMWEPEAGTALLLGGFAPEMMSCAAGEAEECISFGLPGATASGSGSGSGAFDSTNLNVLDACASVGDFNSPFLPDIFA